MHILHSIDIPFFPKEIIARTKQNIQLVETYNLRIRYAWSRVGLIRWNEPLMRWNRLESMAVWRGSLGG